MPTQRGQHTTRNKEHTCSPHPVLYSCSGVKSTAFPLQQVLVRSRGP